VRAPTGTGRSPLKKAAAVAGIAALVCVLACLLLPDVFINPFLGWRVRQAFTEAYPGHRLRLSGFRYDIWSNHAVCDSVSVTGADSEAVFSASRAGVSGIGRLRLLLGGGLAGGWLGDVRAEARDVSLAFARSRHELRCATVQVSAPDSSLTIEGLRYRPPASDEQFFARSAYRRTRYLLDVPSVRVTGLAWLTPGNGCRARAVRIGDASLSVLIDKYKPVDETAEHPRLPGEILASLGIPLKIDSVVLLNGRMVYQERTDEGLTPAVLTVDSVEIRAEGIGNRAGGADTAIVRARGSLMGSTVMRVRMSMPVVAAGLSFSLSGSVGSLELARLNPFVEVSQGLRLKTGFLHSASFDIDVADGRASGVVRASYEDLKIVVIDRRTGSEGDVVDTFVSILANNVRLRTTNMPDGSGAGKAGEVSYERQVDETFLESAWFALRNGLGDMVGF
jgi:hypothetical protein